MVHSNKGDRKGYSGRIWRLGSDTSQSFFISSSEHLYPWYLQHTHCFHRNSFICICVCVHTYIHTHSIRSHLYSPKKKQLKTVKSVPWDVSEHKKLSPVTFSRSSNINTHTSATMSFIKDTACKTTVRKLTSRLYFSPPTDIRSWQKDCIPLAEVVFTSLLWKDYCHERGKFDFIIFLASNNAHHLNTSHHHISEASHSSFKPNLMTNSKKKSLKPLMFL